MIERSEFEIKLGDPPMEAGETPATYAKRVIESLNERWSVVSVSYRSEALDVTDYGSAVPREVLFQEETIVAVAERFRKKKKL